MNAGDSGTSPHRSTSSSSPSPVAVSSTRHTASSPSRRRPPLDDLTGARPAMLDRQHGRPQGRLTAAVEPLAATRRQAGRRVPPQHRREQPTITAGPNTQPCHRSAGSAARRPRQPPLPARTRTAVSGLALLGDHIPQRVVRLDDLHGAVIALPPVDALEALHRVCPRRTCRARRCTPRPSPAAARPDPSSSPAAARAVADSAGRPQRRRGPADGSDRPPSPPAASPRAARSTPSKSSTSCAQPRPRVVRAAGP